MSALKSRRGVDEARVAQEILRWATQKQLRIWWGKGTQDGSFFPMLDHEGTSHWLIAIWTYGRIEVQFQNMLGKPPFDVESKRLELLRRLNDIPNVSIPADAIARRPSIPLSAFVDRSCLDQFVEILDWMVQEIRKTT